MNRHVSLQRDHHLNHLVSQAELLPCNHLDYQRHNRLSDPQNNHLPNRHINLHTSLLYNHRRFPQNNHLVSRLVVLRCNHRQTLHSSHQLSLLFDLPVNQAARLLLNPLLSLHRGLLASPLRNLQ